MKRPKNISLKEWRKRPSGVDLLQDHPILTKKEIAIGLSLAPRAKLILTLNNLADDILKDLGGTIPNFSDVVKYIRNWSPKRG